MASDRLRLERIRRVFKNRVAVDDLDLAVAPGEVACLLGPSGCGKSTTLRIAAGVDRQDAGRVLIDGHVVSDGRGHAPPEARNIGLMFQDFALFPHLTVAENVAFGLDGRDRMTEAAAALAQVDLGGYGALYPHMLSGGEQQRVALARALAPRPSVMLMDEPFSSLDHRLRDAVRDEALRLLKQSGAAVLLVTHDPDEALRMGDKIALMRGGAIVQSGAPFDVYNHPVDRRAAEFFSDVNVVHGVVSGEAVDTPFGRFSTRGVVDDADVEVLIRPQHLQLDIARDGRPEPSENDGVAAAAEVTRARFIGAYSLVETKLAATGAAMTALIPGAYLPPPGEPVWLTLRRDRCFIFPCAVQSRVAFPYFDADGDGRGMGDFVSAAARGASAPILPPLGRGARRSPRI